MDHIEHWPLDRLRAHPENATIFGDPEESAEFAQILLSIKKHGIWEPIVAKRDGTVLAGHVRLTCATQLELETVPVRVHEGFTSYLDEVKFVIHSNTNRRHLTPEQIAHSFKRLKEIPREHGGAKGKPGRRNGSEKGGESATVSGKTRDVAADMLGEGTH